MSTSILPTASPDNAKYRPYIFAGIAFVVFVLCGVGISLAVFEYWWRGTPEYSLGQIRRAIQDRDVKLFRKHVDLRSVASRMIDDMLTENRTGAEANTLAQGLATILKPQMLDSFELQAERFVETGRFYDDARAGEPALQSLKEQWGETGSVEFVTIDGKSATLGLQVTPKGQKNSVVVPLKMRKTEDGFWQVTEVDVSKIRRSNRATGDK